MTNFVRVNELMADMAGGVVTYVTSEIMINADKISSMKEDILLGRACVSIVLDHNAIYVDHTLEGVIGAIYENS